MNTIFIDSCIIIDYINGKLIIEDHEIINYCFNTIVDMEVIIGAKDKRDLHTTNKKLSKFNSVDVDQSILELARELVERYALSHSMAMYDAIIAATCLIYDLPLWTYNKKDFRYIENLELVSSV